VKYGFVAAGSRGRFQATLQRSFPHPPAAGNCVRTAWSLPKWLNAGGTPRKVTAGSGKAARGEPPMMKKRNYRASNACDCPDSPRSARRQEEQMLREALTALTPQCRRLVELLFL